MLLCGDPVWANCLSLNSWLAMSTGTSTYSAVLPMQDTDDWLRADAVKNVVQDPEVRLSAPEKQASTHWGNAKPDASWGGPQEEEPEEGDDILAEAEAEDFTLVVTKKNKKKGRQDDAPSAAGRGRGRRRP